MILPDQLSLSIKNQFLIFKSPCKVILFYGIFPGSFLDILEWLFFLKLWWQKKIIFLQMHNAILQTVKYFLNVQIINPEKIK